MTPENMERRYRPPAAGAKGIPRRAMLALIAGAPAMALAREPDARLPRDQLLLYRSSWTGAVCQARSVPGWQARRREILRGFEAIAGRPPARRHPCPLKLRIEDEVRCDGFVRRLVSYQSEPGSWVPAYLLVPDAALSGRRVPGALCLHQTHSEGQKVVVGLGNSPDDEYGVELARRGFACIAPPYPHLANYWPDLDGLGYASGTMKAVWDNRRVLDVLDSLPFVRRGRYAAIGHSLGGHNAIFTAVHDDRIRVVVTSCAFDSFVDYMRGDLTGWAQKRYLPRLAAYKGRPEEIPFDFYELVGALAPRAFFANAPMGDTNFRRDSVDRIAVAAREVYRLYGAEERLVVRHPDCEHRFPPELRREAYAFIERHLASGT